MRGFVLCAAALAGRVMHHKFTCLDGLRGLAALFVLLRHTGDYWSFYLHRSYLAVDMFFLLSGFVIAHSYEARLAAGQLSALQFIMIRLVRLYPMYLLALAVSMLASTSVTSAAGVGRALAMWPTLSGGVMFPLNVAFWSLSFELAINLLYAVARPWLTNRMLAAAVAMLAAVLAVLVVLTGQLDLGWRGRPLDLAGGLARSAFGFLFGIWLYRHREWFWHWLPHRLGPWHVAVVVSAVFWCPVTGTMDTAVDLVAATLVLPACMLAAGRPTPTRGVRIMTLLGAASYPLYLLHWPLAELASRRFPGWIAANPNDSGLAFAAAVLLMSVLLDRFVDVPVRAWLTRMLRLPGRQHAANLPPVDLQPQRG